MTNTRQRIDDLERCAFPIAFDEPPLSKDYLYSFISKSTFSGEGGDLGNNLKNS